MANPVAALPSHVTICEVGPRDGLQNEPLRVPAADKVRYIELLVAAGIRVLEATSFVSPGAVPQLADADEVFGSISKVDGVRYLTLVPNRRGLDRAIEAGVHDIVVFTAATDAFAQRNIGMTVGESLTTFGAVIARAKAAGMRVRGSISVAFGCPFQGDVQPADAARTARQLFVLGCDELSIADTIGVGTPNQVFAIADALKGAGIPFGQVGFHFHDTRGTAVANVLAALQAGFHEFDTSSGGLGGCPFAPGATGNVATEDVVHMLHGMGIETGIDLAKLRDATRFIGGILEGRIVSRAFRALEAAAARAASA